MCVGKYLIKFSGVDDTIKFHQFVILCRLTVRQKIISWFYVRISFEIHEDF